MPESPTDAHQDSLQLPAEFGGIAGLSLLHETEYLLRRFATTSLFGIIPVFTTTYLAGTHMDATRILTSVFSAMGKLLDYCLNRKQLQRHTAEAASKLVSVLDRYVRDCAAASDDGYLPGANPQYNDYRNRKEQCADPVLALPDIPGWNLLPLRYTDGVRDIEHRQNDISDVLQEAFEGDFGALDEYFAERQRVFAELGFRATLLSRDLRAEYDLMPPSVRHRERETLLEKTLQYHDGFSIRLRRSERRIARQARMSEQNDNQRDG